MVYDDRPPAPCGVQTLSGGDGVTRTRHGMGTQYGVVTLSYNANTVPDMFDIHVDGLLIATTGDFVQGEGTLTFYYSGGTVIVTVTGGQTEGGPPTTWDYVISCPT